MKIVDLKFNLFWCLFFFFFKLLSSLVISRHTKLWQVVFFLFIARNILTFPYIFCMPGVVVRSMPNAQIGTLLTKNLKNYITLGLRGC